MNTVTMITAKSFCLAMFYVLQACMFVGMASSFAVTTTTKTTTTHAGIRHIPSSSSSSSSLTTATTRAFVARGGGGGRNGGGRPPTTPRASTSTAEAASSTLGEEAVVSEENMSLLSERGREVIGKLIRFDIDQGDGSQFHVYGDWPKAGVEDQGKIQLAEQLADLDSSYPGGLVTYLKKAKKLLKESAEGINPFEDYEAVVPEGESLHYDDKDAADSDDDGDGGGMSYDEAEKLGMESLCGGREGCGLVVVLVAGGLGERLGHSDIKLSLETNLCTNETYLQYYCNYILALEKRVQEKGGTKKANARIPLVIMTSGDTDAQTKKLLKDNDYYGMDEDMVKIVMQDKVPALKDGSAGLALDKGNRWSVQTKPHGHGDVHHLLLKYNLLDEWEGNNKDSDDDVSHVVFIQDTNALVVNSIIPALGVSLKREFDMNSICIPRLAGEEAGAIARLEHKTDPSKSLVINVEYNQLDPLLRTQGDRLGDVADPNTGYSPFPGNANNLLMELSSYAKTLRGEDRGVVLEFVNPKYKDGSRTEFKKPTRLECMMQDIPKLFQKELGGDARIGFCEFDRWYTFSPAKNSLETGRDSVSRGGTAASPATVSSAESDMYIQNQRKLRHAGVDLDVTTRDDLVLAAGIPVTPGPRIILSPSFGLTRGEIASRFVAAAAAPDDGKGGGSGAAACSVTKRSSLVLDGHNISIGRLFLDGALVIRAGPDTRVTVDGLRVQNKGWELKELDPDVDYPEHVLIRGYTMERHETAEYDLQEPGNFVIDESGEVTRA